MIPVLYKSDATNFTTFGIGALLDTLSCEVTEERNSVYECVLKYPITGQHYSEIARERIIKAKANDTSAPQAFRIYRITKPLNGIVTVYAQHISYDLTNIATPAWKSTMPIPPQMAIEQAFNAALSPHSFTFRTDYTTFKDFVIDKPKSLRSVLGGSAGSLVDLWGGEFEWDNFNVIHHQGRGANTGVVIEYGKNLTSLEHDTDITAVYTDLLPYAVAEDLSGNENVITLTEQILPITDTILVQRKTLIKDLTDSFEGEEVINEENLRAKALAYLENNPLGTTTPSLTISFEPLWKQPEYSALLERVSLCDRVTIRHTDLGVEATAKVIKTVYDTLAEKYRSITLGSARTSLVDTVSDTQTSAQDTASKVDRLPILVNSAIQNATDRITGQTGGYVVLHTATDTGQPYELLILDAPNIDDAVNVWRWNVGGLGFSDKGYNGPYGTAITADGQIVADFITSGTLIANIIKAGILSSNDGSSYWNLETGEVVIKAYATSSDLNNAVDGLEGTIGQVETSLTQKANAIELKVDANATSITSLRVTTGQIEARVTSAEGNISSLTTSVNGIAARVSTAEGDISSLEQTATSLTTRITNAENDVSAIEQNVSSITTRVTTAEGNISSLTTSVNGIATRVSTAEGNISTLTQNVTGITARVATAEGNISSLTTDINGVRTDVSNLEGDVSNIEQDVSSITTRVTSAEGNISSLTTSVGGISTRVSTAEGNISTISQSVSALTTRVESAEGDISTLEQTTSSLSATVSTKLSSSGGATTSFGWSLTSSGFYLYSNSSTVMSVTSSGLSVSGSVTATSGTIGGFTIGTSSLYKTKTAYSNTTSGVYVGTDGIGLGAGTFYVTSAGYLYATSGKIGGMSISGSQMYSSNFILGTVYDANDATKSFTTLSFGSTSGSTFSATTVLTNSGCYMYSLSSDYIACGEIRAVAIKADAGIATNTGFYFGLDGGSTTYTAKLTWSGQIIYLKIYNENGVETALADSKSFTVHYACIWGKDTTWNATVAKGSSSTSVDTDAFWGIDYATFNYSSSNKAQHSLVFTISGTSAASTITSYGHILPWFNNTYDLGGAAYKWRNIYGQAGIVNTSDRNEKFDIAPMTDIYSQIFDTLRPVSFKYVDNDNQRTHTGLVAQDVKESVLGVGLTTKEFAGYCEWENEDKSIGCGLRYSEFVAMNIYEIQKLKARVTQLENLLKGETPQ